MSGISHQHSPSPFLGDGDGSSPRHPVKINVLAAPAGIPVTAAAEHWIQEWITQHIPAVQDSHRAMMDVGNTRFDVRTLTLPSGAIRHVFFQVGQFPEAATPAPTPDSHRPGEPGNGRRRVRVIVSATAIVVPGLLAWSSRAYGANGVWPWLLPTIVGAGLFAAWLRMRAFLKERELAGLSLFVMAMGVLTWISVWFGLPYARIYLEKHNGKNVELSQTCRTGTLNYTELPWSPTTASNRRMARRHPGRARLPLVPPSSKSGGGSSPDTRTWALPPNPCSALNPCGNRPCLEQHHQP